MKRNLLFLLTFLLTNALFAQPFVEIITPSAQVSVNSATGATVAFNVKFYKEITIPGTGISFYAPINFRMDESSSIVTTGDNNGSFSISPDNSIAGVNGGLSGQKIVTVTIPKTATIRQIFALNIVVMDGNTALTGTALITVSQVIVVLPITLSSFEAVQKEKNIALSWSTESEKDNSSFIVERSENGKDFKPIGEVKSGGNTHTTQKYGFEDTEPSSTVNYYHIRSVDNEGKSDLSKVVSVIKKGAFDLKVFPTPEGARVQIGADEIGTEATIQVLNLNGQVISSKQVRIDASITETSLDIPNTGIFIVNVKTDSKSVSKSVSTKVFKY